MAVSGPKPKPHLQVVREGNPGRRPPKEGLKLAPGAPAEPDWRDWFGVTRGKAADDNRRARADARAAWFVIVPQLDIHGILASIDLGVLADTCVCWARIRQCERDVSRNGLSTWGTRGEVANPAVNAAAKYRQQWKFYVAELGLSPSSRTRLEGREAAGDDDNPFDV